MQLRQRMFMLVEEKKLMQLWVKAVQRMAKLPYNFRTEAVDKMTYTREWGARFITCIPKVVIY
jgi:hypothetical protein